MTFGALWGCVYPTKKNIEVKTPARGLSPQYYFDLIGKKSPHDIKKGTYLQIDDLK